MPRRALLILATLATGAIALRLWLPGALDPRQALAWLETMGFAGQVAAFVVGYTVLTTFAVPAVVMHVVAGLAFGVERGIPIALIGGNLSSNLHFAIGRALGARRVHAWLTEKGVARHLDRHSIVSVMLLRALPLPFVGVNVGCGASGLKWSHFALGSGLGLVAATTAQTLFAAQLYAGVEGARLSAFAWAAGAGLSIVGLLLLGNWLRNRSEGGP
jgi:uncharacterized membrane protein YdjX (TVP38/TMEM64 family)